MFETAPQYTLRMSQRMGRSKLSTCSIAQIQQHQQHKYSRVSQYARDSSHGSLSLRRNAMEPPPIVETVESKWRKLIKVVLPHVLLVLSTVGWTLVGAIVFYSIERPNEWRAKNAGISIVDARQARLIDELWAAGADEGAFDRAFDAHIDEFVGSTFDAFKIGLTPGQLHNNTPIVLQWTGTSSLFFTTTVITTIGYGHLVPVTLYGKLFCIVYALFGIPLTLITIADLGKFVSDGLKWTYYKATGGVGDEDEYLAITVPAYVILLILLGYCCFGAYMFTLWEDWSFGNSFYFFFITLVTVGFGDLVPREEGYVKAMMFIYLGMILTTTALDLVGADAIEWVHYFGTSHLANAKKALAAWGQRTAALDQVHALQHMPLHDPAYLEAILRNRIKCPNAFSPTLSNLKYIDAFNASSTMSDRPSNDNTPRRFVNNCTRKTSKFSM